MAEEEAQRSGNSGGTGQETFNGDNSDHEVDFADAETRALLWEERFLDLQKRLDLLLSSPVFLEASKPLQSTETRNALDRHSEERIETGSEPGTPATLLPRENILVQSSHFPAQNLGSNLLLSGESSLVPPKQLQGFQSDAKQFLSTPPAVQQDRGFSSGRDGWETLSRSLIQKYIPAPYSGIGNSDPVTFVRSLRSMLRLQPLSLPHFILLTGAILTDRAARWFRSIQDTLRDTESFFEAFEKEFVSRQYVKALNSKIRKEHQGRNETAVAFVDRMTSLFNCLPSDPTDLEIVESILDNMRPELGLHLTGREFSSVGALRAAAHKLDEYAVKGAITSRTWQDSSRPVYEQRRSYGTPAQREGFTTQPRSSEGETVWQVRGQNRESARPAHTSGTWGSVTCFACNQRGHVRRHCPNRRQGNEPSVEVEIQRPGGFDA